MVVRYFSTLIFICLTLGSKCQSIFSVLHLNEEREVHQGIPQSISETKIFYNTNSTETKRELTIFDHLGLRTSTTFFDENKNITSIVSYKYDTTNRRILESRIKEINTRFPTNRIHSVYEYDSSKSPIRIKHSNERGDILTDIILKNNSLGLPIELQLYEPTGNLIGIEVASYLPEENKAIVSVGNSLGKILSSDTMKISFKNAYKFNDPNFKYNEKGDIVFAKSKWLNGTIHFSEYEYIYDYNDNWIEYKSFEVTYKTNGKKKRVLKSHFKREILYWSKT